MPYRHVPLRPTPGADDREILRAMNPNCHIPVLDDAGLIVWESMAINLYLADKHPGNLMPADPARRAIVYQWSFRVQTEIDRPDWAAARRSGDQSLIATATQDKIAALGILDQALTGQDYLFGDSFSLAALNVAGSISQPNEGGKIDWQRFDPVELGIWHPWVTGCRDGRHGNPGGESPSSTDRTSRPQPQAPPSIK